MYASEHHGKKKRSEMAFFLIALEGNTKNGHFFQHAPSATLTNLRIHFLIPQTPNKLEWRSSSFRRTNETETHRWAVETKVSCFGVENYTKLTGYIKCSPKVAFVRDQNPPYDLILDHSFALSWHSSAQILSSSTKAVEGAHPTVPKLAKNART